MKEERTEALGEYRAACEEIARVFVDTYHNTYPGFTDESRWIADDVGGVLEIGDYFWNMEDMVTALEMECKEKILFQWYDESLEHYLKAGQKEGFINLENFIKLKSTKPLEL